MLMNDDRSSNRCISNSVNGTKDNLQKVNFEQTLNRSFIFFFQLTDSCKLSFVCFLLSLNVRVCVNSFSSQTPPISQRCPVAIVKWLKEHKENLSEIWKWILIEKTRWKWKKFSRILNLLSFWRSGNFKGDQVLFVQFLKVNFIVLFFSVILFQLFDFLIFLIFFH